MLLTRRQALSLAPVCSWLRLWAQPRRLTRRESFFGIHLDLHPNDSDKFLGRDVSEAMVENFLNKVKPDYVQYDCKGHAGYLGYPSKVSTTAPMIADSLAVWRKVTAAHGVALYIHFSGVWDSLAVKERPEWARGRPDGGAEDRQTSTFGPYADERMIPQLLEVSEKYALDGVWVDGECWATNPDYSSRAAEAFRKATGIAELPRSAADKGWLEFLGFNREQFRRYVRHYIEVVHKERPGFQIASNWLYSTFVPERPELPVDFISGDYLGNASISQARLQARYMAQTGRPWDLMAWGFQSARNNTVGPIHKPAANLMQEAAVVLAQGGGFQIYYQPTRGGHIDDLHVGVMAKVAAFCRARQKACHQSEPVPQVGVLFSKNTLYTTAHKLFGGWGNAEAPAQGLIDALLENHYSVDVIPDWKLAEAAAQWPCIAVPDWAVLGDDVVSTLKHYVRGGGRLLVAGAANARLFAAELGITPVGEPSNLPAYIPGEEVFANVGGLWQDAELSGARLLLPRHPTYDATRGARPAASVAVAGQGKSLGFFGPLGGVFSATHAPETRRVVGRLMRELFQPVVELDAPHTVEIALRRRNARMALHLINTTAMQVASNYAAIDFIPPVGPLHIRLRLPRPPANLRLEPAGTPLTGRWQDGVFNLPLAGLDLYDIITWDAT